MRNPLWISLIASTLLAGSDRVEFFGSTVDVNGSAARAGGNPVVVYQDSLLSADELRYDHNESVVEAIGSVNVFRAGRYHALSDYARVGLENDTQYLKPYYMYDQSIGVWMNTAEARGCENTIDLESGAVSGCDSTAPLWKIRFSSADYNTESMWVNLYNARLEIGDVPVFYLPYFGYPTDRTRRSGLLIPSFGLSNAEGVYYQQPIYFAPQNWWDLELRPQIRTLRGEGVYTDFRFVDTPSSKGSFRVGYFREQSGYAREYDLANLDHYGYDIHYRHSAPLREWLGVGLSGESGLYVDGSWMNDVDYLNLQQSDETQSVTDNQVLSRINAYYGGEDNYAGAYFKHYQYLDRQSNAQTIQILPSLQYHRFLESFFRESLLVSADATATHFYRPEGKNALQGELNIPLTLQTSLFDEYLDVAYTAHLSSKGIGFYGDVRPDETANNRYETGIYAQLDHTLSLSSSLVRPYESLTHVLSPRISYTEAGSRHYSGYYETYHGSCDPATTGYAGYPCEFYTLEEPSDMLSLGLNNYLFREGKQTFVDRLSQNFRYDDEGSHYGELQNELEWEVTPSLSYYNQTAYNHDRNRITKEQNTLRYNDGTVTAGVSHYYTDQLQNDAAVYSSYWTADAAYRHNDRYRFFGLVAYDYREDMFKRGEVGFLYSQRCLDFGLRFVQNRRPILTNVSVSDSVDESYIFITIILKPLGGSEFNYKLTSN